MYQINYIINFDIETLIYHFKIHQLHEFFNFQNQTQSDMMHINSLAFKFNTLLCEYIKVNWTLCIHTWIWIYLILHIQKFSIYFLPNFIINIIKYTYTLNVKYLSKRTWITITLSFKKRTHHALLYSLFDMSLCYFVLQGLWSIMICNIDIKGRLYICIFPSWYELLMLLFFTGIREHYDL